ncbi:AAA family ATPase [Salinarimonas soli]|uniref:AAA family ATPase n=1 Tax=Salinarimonas soli TaxID=1638099 RepID=A0A5B2V9T4_9HYPH|nr:AAA family ATPase [Salinarimonas soli]KAA2234997.1 AAA family ATPase [Salinarimonas soli]
MPDMTDTGERLIAPVPRVAIQAFCETPDVATAIEAAATDRRMQKTHLKVQTGGGAAAVESYRHAPTPNVIVLEAPRGAQDAFLGQLDSLAESCDAGTKVLVVGHVNDVLFYRDLMRRGVSEYLIAPVEVLEVVRAISELFNAPGAEPVGRSVAVVGAKGGVGASTVAHNIAWSVARAQGTATVIVDLDIAFGTAGLDFNQDPPQGIAEAIFSPDRLDANLVDRLLSKCSDNLSLLAAPAMLDRTCDLAETSVDGVIDILRNTVPCVVLDVPHVWTAWSRRILVSADEIVIVATPDLASLRNTKNLFDLLKSNRPNDRRPRVILNMTAIPKRPEIAPAEFAKAIGTELAGVLAFDAPLFGTAANNGQMIAEVQPSGKVAESFDDIAAAIMGRPEAKRTRSAGLLDPLLTKIVRRKAS